MMMGKQVRRNARQISHPTSTNNQFGPRPFAAPEPERESLDRRALLEHSFGEIDLFPIQPKLKLGPPEDRYEQEADRVAEQIMRMPEPCPKCQVKSKDEHTFRAIPIDNQITNPLQREKKGEATQIKQADDQTSRISPRLEARISSLRGSGHPLTESVRAFFEPRFGRDFSEVRLHTDAEACRLNCMLNARAFTTGRDIFFSQGAYNPITFSGHELLAHELTHVVQQGQALQNDSLHSKDLAIQRQVEQPETEEEQLIEPLTAEEWQLLQLWQSIGEVGIDPLTDNPNHNALVVAEAIFCRRALFYLINNQREDPLLCVDSEVTRADPRVQQLVQHVTARGPIINWARVNPNQRMRYVMELLVNTYGFPENGAAGLVGNLWAESGVLPTRIEGSRPETPMTAPNFAGQSTAFTAEQVMNRNLAARQGPRRPGIGLAQWTSPSRRAGLFQHMGIGPSILFNMDAQVDYLVTELQNSYPRVYSFLTRAGVSLNDASDEVVYRFEVPRSILDAQSHLLPRSDPAVQRVFRERRVHSQRALRVFRNPQR